MRTLSILVVVAGLALTACSSSTGVAPASPEKVASTAATSAAPESTAPDETSPVYDQAAAEAWASLTSDNHVFVCGLYTDGTDSGQQAGIAAVITAIQLGTGQQLDGNARTKADASAKKLLDANC